MADISERVKTKILAKLDADSSVTSLVPARSIFPMQVASDQTYPFVRYGPPTVVPYEDWCGSGSIVSVTLHCFATGESAAQKIAAAIEYSLSRMENVVDYNWVRTQFRQDPDEAGVWDGMVTIEVTDR